MFKFNFELDADDIDVDSPLAEDGVAEMGSRLGADQCSDDTSTKSFTELSLSDLLGSLPPSISYSPLTVPLMDGSTIYLSRRDLYDAKFQVISQEGSTDYHEAADQGGSDLSFLEVPSDLVPGVYEGGLKTWECSLDLAAYLHGTIGTKKDRQPNRMLELGCGTAVPTLYFLQCSFLGDRPKSTGSTDVHLQDFNELVLRLVTVPNLILSWYMSPSSLPYRQSMSVGPPSEGAETLPPADPAQTGDLPISPALIRAFLDTLKLKDINIRLFSGSWDTFDFSVTGGQYDLVVTSETIYRRESLPALIGLLQHACVTAWRADVEESFIQSAPKMTIPPPPNRPCLCLVAAKFVYFGVGGGVSEFIQAVESESALTKGKVETVWERKEGVKRSIMKINWADP